MKTIDFLKGRRASELAPDERDALERGLGAPQPVAARTVLVRRGVAVEVSTLLIEGLVGRYMEDLDGNRQLVALHVPGDFLDLHAFPLRHLDHDVATLTDSVVAMIEHKQLLRITETHAHLTRLLWFSTLLDAAMHREWIFRLGRLDGPGRVAHLVAETAERLAVVGRCDGRRFDLPITQSDIAEACGLTNVHVSRVLTQLRSDGVVDVRGSLVTILDAARLRHLAEFDPQYLYHFDGLTT